MKPSTLNSDPCVANQAEAVTLGQAVPTLRVWQREALGQRGGYGKWGSAVRSGNAALGLRESKGVDDARYKSVNLGAGKSLGSPSRCLQLG